MSALAQFLVFQGAKVSGSDRSFDKGAETQKRSYFQRIGIHLHPQDGSSLQGCSCLIVSTAIENQNPEVQKARALGIPVIHRSELLAELARLRNTIAISGTSGKSTVTGMTYHILEAGGLNPSLITGANLISLQAEGLLGNAKAGVKAASTEAPDWLVMEADESDGSLVQYCPEVGVILNVEKDHKEITELMPLFNQFRDQTLGQVILNGADPLCMSLKRKQDIVFFPDAMPEGRVENLKLGDWDTHFNLAGVAFEIRVPGRHNLANAMAAITVGRALGISLFNCAKGLNKYQGVERRHVKIGIVKGVTVVDDFAHNPSKVKACLETVKAAADGSRRRILAIFHPHGFAPMKLFGKDLVQNILSVLDSQDRIFMPEIYYAGGTADKSISSADLIRWINSEDPESRPPIGRFFPTKAEVLASVVAEARPGDWIVSMGARDPALAEFAESLLQGLKLRMEPPR